MKSPVALNVAFEILAHPRGYGVMRELGDVWNSEA
jgi:hypothetical protein